MFSHNIPGAQAAELRGKARGDVQSTFLQGSPFTPSLLWEPGSAATSAPDGKGRADSKYLPFGICGV